MALDLQTPLQGSLDVYLWAAVSRAKEVSFKLIHTPQFTETYGTGYVIMDRVNNTFDQWFGVTFPVPVDNLRVYLVEDYGKEIVFVDNRGNNIKVDEFTPKDPLYCRAKQIYLSWTIDAIKYRFDLSTPMMQQLMKPVHSYHVGL